MSFQEEISMDNAGLYHKQKIRNRNDLNARQIGHNVVHDEKRRAGTLRPVRNAPALFKKGDVIDNERYVWPQGKILGKYDRRIHDGANWVYQSDKYKLGVSDTATGEFYGFRDASDTPQLVPFNDPTRGNTIDIDGLVAPFNGSFAHVQEHYGVLDEDLGIIRPTDGNEINAATATTDRKASLRDAGDPATSRFELFGVAISDTMRETRNNNYQYFRETQAIAVSRSGKLTVPFYILGANADETTVAGASANWAAAATLGTTYADWQAVVAASLQRAVSLDQTVLFVDSAASLATGATIKCDNWGNPLISASSDYFEIEFGSLESFTHGVTTPYAKWVNTYPEMDLTGTGTAGADYDVFKLAKKVQSFLGQPTDIKSVYDAIMVDGNFGWATIYYDIG